MDYNRPDHGPPPARPPRTGRTEQSSPSSSSSNSSDDRGVAGGVARYQAKKLSCPDDIPLLGGETIMAIFSDLTYICPYSIPGAIKVNANCIFIQIELFSLLLILLLYFRAC